MTELEKKLLTAVSDRVGGLTAEQAVEVLFRLELIDRRTCERLAIHEEVWRLRRAGVPVTKALYAVAGKFCCSYEKVRKLFYDSCNNKF